jgi:hypothetical protein
MSMLLDWIDDNCEWLSNFLMGKPFNEMWLVHRDFYNVALEFRQNLKSDDPIAVRVADSYSVDDVNFKIESGMIVMLQQRHGGFVREPFVQSQVIKFIKKQ